MNIINKQKDSKLVEFKTLGIGDCFKGANNHYFMIVQNNKYNVVDLNSCHLYKFVGDTLVIPCRGDLEIEEILDNGN